MGEIRTTLSIFARLSGPDPIAEDTGSSIYKATLK